MYMREKSKRNYEGGSKTGGGGVERVNTGSGSRGRVLGRPKVTNSMNLLAFTQEATLDPYQSQLGKGEEWSVFLQGIHLQPPLFFYTL